MKNKSSKQVGRRLLPVNSKLEQNRAFKDSVKKTRTLGTATGNEDDPFDNDENDTTSIVKRNFNRKTANKLEDQEEPKITLVNPNNNPIQPKPGVKYNLGFVAAGIVIIGGIITIIYFFSDFFTKTAVNTTKIESIETRQNELKNDLSEDLNKVENRLNKRIDGVENKMDKKVDKK